MYSRGLKRAFDCFGAALGLLLLSPLFLLIAVAVRLRLGSPVIFRQQRPGRDGRPFTIFKFRTMRPEPASGGVIVPDAERLTRLGDMLRAASVDELPELVNVLRGEMSMVGPRPLLMEYLPLYSADQARRHAVRPGLTGWAQVRGRNALGWDEKFALDTWYVEHVSVSLDLRILVMTALQVFRRRGISHGDHVTMPRFRGDTEGRDS